jgi:hypothetical protein
MFCALVWSRDSKFKWFEKVPKGALKGTSKGRNARVTGMDIEELQKKVVEFRDARDWEQYHNPKDLAISLMLEAGELLEIFQWKNAEELEAIKYTWTLSPE